MANLDQPVGFEPFGKLISAKVYLSSEIIYPGDLLKFSSAGKVSRVAASDAAMGVALSYAAADADVLVADSPLQFFVGQADDATIDAQTDLGLNYDVVVGSPNTSYKRSGMMVDASTQATTATLPLKVISIQRGINNALGSLVDVVCKINNHQLGSHTGTAGV